MSEQAQTSPQCRQHHSTEPVGRSEALQPRRLQDATCNRAARGGSVACLRPPVGEASGREPRHNLGVCARCSAQQAGLTPQPVHKQSRQTNKQAEVEALGALESIAVWDCAPVPPTAVTHGDPAGHCPTKRPPEQLEPTPAAPAMLLLRIGAVTGTTLGYSRYSIPGWWFGCMRTVPESPDANSSEIPRAPAFWNSTLRRLA